MRQETIPFDASNARRIFPASDVPAQIFSSAHSHNDITDDLVVHFCGKRWTDVLLDDWIHCADVETIRMYMSASAFHYYLPSLLIAAIDNRNYLDWGVRALLPDNRGRVPKGTRWQVFRSLFSKDQERLIRGFLISAKTVAEPGDGTWELADLGLSSLW